MLNIYITKHSWQSFFTVCTIFFMRWQFKCGGKRGGWYYAAGVVVDKKEEEGCSNSRRVCVAYEGWFYYVDHFK